MIKKIFSLLNLPKLKTVAMAIIVIVAAFVTGRLIGWVRARILPIKNKKKGSRKLKKEPKKIYSFLIGLAGLSVLNGCAAPVIVSECTWSQPIYLSEPVVDFIEHQGTDTDIDALGTQNKNYEENCL